MTRLKRLIGLSILGSVALMHPLQGSDSDQLEIVPKRRCEGLEAFGQALYWKYTGSRTKYTFDGGIEVAPNLIKQTVNTYNYDTQWGFRVGLAWSAPSECLYGELSYLRLAKQRGVEGFGITQGSFFNLVGPVAGSLGNEYQNADLTIGAYFYRCGRLSMQAYGGGRWIYLREVADINPTTLFGIGYLHDVSTFRGGAFKLGGGAAYCCSIFRFFGAFDVLAVVGEQRGFDYAASPGATSFAIVVIPESKSLTITTGVDAKVGVKVMQPCGCVSVYGEVGYEIQNYFDILRATVRNGDIIRALSNGDAGFAGFYGSLKVGY